MPCDAHHRNGKMAAAAGHCQDMRSRSLSPSVVARYGIRSKQHSGCSLRGGVGRGKRCLSDARRSSSAQHAYMRLPTDSTARRASTRRPATPAQSRQINHRAWRWSRERRFWTWLRARECITTTWRAQISTDTPMRRCGGDSQKHRRDQIRKRRRREGPWEEGRAARPGGTI